MHFCSFPLRYIYLIDDSWCLLIRSNESYIYFSLMVTRLFKEDRTICMHHTKWTPVLESNNTANRIILSAHLKYRYKVNILIICGTYILVSLVLLLSSLLIRIRFLIWILGLQDLICTRTLYTYVRRSMYRLYFPNK